MTDIRKLLDELYTSQEALHGESAMAANSGVLYETVRDLLTNPSIENRDIQIKVLEAITKDNWERYYGIKN